MRCWQPPPSPITCTSPIAAKPKFALFNRIVDRGPSYVCRLRANSVWTVVEENYRNNNAGLDEIISDEIVEFCKGSGHTHPFA